MFPVIDLHCHLDGSLSESLIRQLASRSGIAVPESSGELISKLSAPYDCQSLLQYLECFDLPVACLQTKENLFDAAKEVVLDAAKDHVIYLEVRFAPLLHIKGGLKVQEVIECVVEGVHCGVRQVSRDCPDRMIAAGVIVCGMRHMAADENVRMLKAAECFLGHGVCGVDIAGGEDGFPPMVQKPLFDLARDMHMPITIHAGECGSVSNVLEAVQLGTKRIGHGIALYKDADARRVIAQKGIALELCPVSNLQTKAISHWEDYPFRMFMDEGLKVTVNTDNRTVSQTSMTNEFRMLRRYCGLSAKDQRQVLFNSIDAAFAPDEVKARLFKFVNK